LLAAGVVVFVAEKDSKDTGCEEALTFPGADGFD
jgi:hypothetical protein